MPPKEIVWELDEHSLGKHLVFERYLNAWLPILSRSGSDKLLVIDGFSGPGVYANGYKGSPIIALDAAIKHTDKQVRKTEVLFVFIEENKERLTYLESYIAETYPLLPSNVKVFYRNGRFDESMNDILDMAESSKKVLAPCFVMVDPFGVSDTPMSVIKRLLSNPKSEVYISVMYEFINRFLNSKEFAPHLTKLFGTDEWVKAREIEDRNEKRKFIYDLYKRELKNSGAKNAINFDLYKGNRHVYSIFFATQAWQGTNRMKEAIWKIAPSGDFAYRGGHEMELDILSVDSQALIDAIVGEFSGKWVDITKIISFVGSDKTDYHESQVRRLALKVLESENRIEIHPDHIVGRRKGAFTKDMLFRVI